MPKETTDPTWDLDSAIDLLKSLSVSNYQPRISTIDDPATSTPPPATDVPDDRGLGSFPALWDFLGCPQVTQHNATPQESVKFEVNDVPVAEVDFNQLGKGVRWRDEVDGADLEDNVEPVKLSAATLKNQKRAERRARAKERAEKLRSGQGPVSDTNTDAEQSAEELESLRRSPDRRAVIDDILGRTRPRARDSSPPTSPSPPKAEFRTPTKKDWPVANPFLWSAPSIPSPSHRVSITARDGLTSKARKQKLITALAQDFPDEKKYLKNSGLVEPAFTPLNVSDIGIHVFVDISNISIGFHDCLKVVRDLPRDTRVRRVPLSFHNFSLVLERGRPAAKRVLVGSDKHSSIQQAKTIGYETNILERVHKAKELTPRQKKYAQKPGDGKGTASSGMGETSGSETNAFGHGGPHGFAPQKWVEQAVDEILHLKILESLIDADRPSTIVLATGDAAEAEYSGGFMKMVERALEKRWMVELVSFKLNTSSLYRRKEFRMKWGPMFKWVVLDKYVEMLFDEDEY